MLVMVPQGNLVIQVSLVLVLLVILDSLGLGDLGILVGQGIQGSLVTRVSLVTQVSPVLLQGLRVTRVSQV
jgi:hypothetical protein